MKDIEEKELVQLCTQGDLQAFETLVKRYEGKVFAVAFRLCSDRQEAEDLAQETFIRAWKALPNFRGEASLSTWLITIVTNLWRDRQRKHRLPVDSLDEPVVFQDGESLVQVADSRPGPEDIVETQELRLQLMQWIEGLKPEFRLVLVLRDIQGMSYEEVAAITRLPIGTVKSRINRARHYLKDQVLASREQIRNQSRLNHQNESIGRGGEKG